MSDRDDLTDDLFRGQLGPRLDTLQVNLSTVTVGPADRLRGRGDRRRRNATAGALVATLAAVTVLGLGTVRALEPQSQPARPVTVVPVPPTPVERADGQADTRIESPVLEADSRLRLPGALLGPELLPAHAGVHWSAGPIRTGPQLWATADDDHEHCWGRLLAGPAQEVARHFRLVDDPAGTEADEVLVLARDAGQATAAMTAARRRCSAGATTPVFSPSPGSPPVIQFKNLNGLDGFVHTRDATSLDGVANRPNCEYAVLLRRGALLVLMLVRQRAYSYDLPRSDAIAVSLQALDRALANTTDAAGAGS